ncbi:MAG: D-alanine--D-alanine ligase [Planctomycetota bacterium]|nr:D-alanine--D-alanine ligase [Planctomycetota bacterium]MEC8512647.1 D-alanine--D-alanine ligase [Planctomycetota bacterium]
MPRSSRLRIAVLMHEALVPPESIAGLDDEQVDQFKMEYDVTTALQGLGHDVIHVPVADELKPIRAALREHRPHVAFNLLMHFHDAGIYDSAVVAWLELRKQRYTGCNPRGLLVANDKALCKKVLHYHRIRAPKFFVVPRGKAPKKLPKGLRWPLFVKSRSEHSSTGISQASIVHDPEQLSARVSYVHEQVGTAALCEEYIEGRELTIGVLGNKRVEVSPVWEIFMDDLPAGVANITTSRVKWDRAYQKKIGLRTGPAEGLDGATVARIQRTARRIHRALGLSGYSRIDMRMDADGQVWILEANPNPDLCFGEDFAESFETRGYSYPELLMKIVRLGRSYEAPWMG